MCVLSFFFSFVAYHRFYEGSIQSFRIRPDQVVATRAREYAFFIHFELLNGAARNTLRGVLEILARKEVCTHVLLRKICFSSKNVLNLPYFLLLNDRVEGCEGRSQSAQGIHFGQASFFISLEMSPWFGAPAFRELSRPPLTTFKSIWPDLERKG